MSEDTIEDRIALLERETKKLPNHPKLPRALLHTLVDIPNRNVTIVVGIAIVEGVRS